MLDNAIETMNGFASNIRVTLHEDGSSITVEDDGRGIPIDTHPTTKKSALEVIFTVLHAGGKFEQGNYKTAGGLHGVGASVVNALSKELVASVKRDGALCGECGFARGRPDGPLRRSEPRGTGTTVYFHPDATIFPKIEFDAAIIRERLEVASYIHKGSEGHLRRRDHQDPHGVRARRRSRRVSAQDHRRAQRQADSRIAFHDHQEDGTRLDLAMQWTEATDEHLRSVCERHSDRFGRHARKRSLVRRPR